MVFRLEPSNLIFEGFARHNRANGHAGTESYAVGIPLPLR